MSSADPSPRTTLSRALLIPLLALSLASTGCKKEAKAETKPDPKAKVTTVAAAEVATPRYLRLTGTLRGAQETELAANVNGRVLKTFVDRGAEVEKGTLLAQVDTQAAQLALAEARVQVETSKTQKAINESDCARYEQLKAKGAVSDLEYDKVTAACKTAPLSVEAAQARASIAAKNVGDGMIRAPFAGIVSERFVEVGAYVQTSSRVVSLAQVRDLKLEFSTPEVNFPDVKTGAKVQFRVSAYGTQVFDGTVIHVAGAIRDTRDFLVEASVPNPDLKLAPGMFADVDVEIGSRPLPAVPKTAVFEQSGKQNLFVVKNGLLEQRVIQAERELAGQIPIVRGVSKGDQVVVTYDPALKNGQGVE